ncbi:MAG: hypothetical protein GY858_09915 [Candidatus Omnitrophica bacterium]|nr:hypothetical protein [Candidatus Omnitrophota bacterium]
MPNEIKIEVLAPKAQGVVNKIRSYARLCGGGEFLPFLSKILTYKLLSDRLSNIKKVERVIYFSEKDLISWNKEHEALYPRLLEGTHTAAGYCIEEGCFFEDTRRLAEILSAKEFDRLKLKSGLETILQNIATSAEGGEYTEVLKRTFGIESLVSLNAKMLQGIIAEVGSVEELSFSGPESLENLLEGINQESEKDPFALLIN